MKRMTSIACLTVAIAGIVTLIPMGPSSSVATTASAGPHAAIFVPAVASWKVVKADEEPPNNGTGHESKFGWALELSLDVQWAHATAPKANILLVTTPTAETLGVQGFPQMMNALQYVVDNDLADIVSMSFGAGEGSFHNGLAALQQMRQGMIDAKARGVTLFASSGDFGSTGLLKEPVKNPALIPYPSVSWPASDPL